MQFRDGVDGYVMKGVAGRDDEAYAPDADDLIKILAEDGVTVEYAESEKGRERLLLKSADWWGPILVFTAQALASGAGTLLADAIWQVIGKAHRGRKIHLEVGSARDGDGKVTWFRGAGSAEEVLEALKVWRGE